VSLILVEGDRPGLTRSPLAKMGWRCSDTATLSFDGVRVPATNLIGAENSGFKGIMLNFNNERLMLAAMAEGLMRVCYDEALGWAQQRKTFGRRLADHQVLSTGGSRGLRVGGEEKNCVFSVRECMWGLPRKVILCPRLRRGAAALHDPARVLASRALRHASPLACVQTNKTKTHPKVIRHKLVDMATAVNSTRAMLIATAHAAASGQNPVAEICQLKNHATTSLERVASDAVQVLGGAGFVEGLASERIFRETKVLQIGGGSTEIMKDLAARQMKM